MADAKDKKSKPAEKPANKKPAKDDADGGGDEDGDGGGKVPEGFNAWPSIVLLSNVATSFRKCATMKTEGKAFEPFSSWLDKPITYRSKVKLHGQNGAVNITADQVQVQSRNQFLPVRDRWFCACSFFLSLYVSTHWFVLLNTSEIW